MAAKQQPGARKKKLSQAEQTRRKKLASSVKDKTPTEIVMSGRSKTKNTPSGTVKNKYQTKSATVEGGKVTFVNGKRVAATPKTKPKKKSGLKTTGVKPPMTKKAMAGLQKKKTPSKPSTTRKTSAPAMTGTKAGQGSMGKKKKPSFPLRKKLANKKVKF